MQFGAISKRHYLDVGLIGFLIIFYTVGTTGILLPRSREWFLDLSFLNLLLSFGVILVARRSKHLFFLGFLLLCFSVGMCAEWIGTKTGLLFGDYAYGENLGPKLWGVPWVIGLNWGILVVTAASLVAKLRLSALLSAVLGAALMTLMDFFMEPVAITSDYWSWHTAKIPIYNYVCWFGVSLPLHYLYYRFELIESNKVFDFLFCILILFFLVLNIV